jgi:hypothetical protein
MAGQRCAEPRLKNQRRTNGKLLKQRGQKLRSTAKAANCSKADLEFESGKQEIAALAV